MSDVRDRRRARVKSQHVCSIVAKNGRSSAPARVDGCFGANLIAPLYHLALDGRFDIPAMEPVAAR
jgi:hypothetical protein